MNKLERTGTEITKMNQLQNFMWVSNKNYDDTQKDPR